MTKTYEATLIRGISYSYKGIMFMADVSQNVTEEIKDYLEVNAVDLITLDDKSSGKRSIKEPKFAFVVTGDQDDDVIGEDEEDIKESLSKVTIKKRPGRKPKGAE